MGQKKQIQKPSLYLLKGDNVTTETLAALYEKLMGKKPTEEELKKAREMVGNDRAQSMDTQIIEILGRNRLVNELLVDELEVAIPLRDRGIDLIANVDLAAKASKFAAVPIQMKAASTRAFSIDTKYANISNLVIAYVWGLHAPEHAQIFALTYSEAVGIAKAMKWTVTASWAKGAYSTSSPSNKLCKLLAPFKMSPGDWRKKVSRVCRVALQPAIKHERAT